MPTLFFKTKQVKVTLLTVLKIKSSLVFRWPSDKHIIRGSVFLFFFLSFRQGHKHKSQINALKHGIDLGISNFPQLIWLCSINLAKPETKSHQQNTGFIQQKCHLDRLFFFFGQTFFTNTLEILFIFVCQCLRINIVSKKKRHQKASEYFTTPVRQYQSVTCDQLGRVWQIWCGCSQIAKHLHYRRSSVCHTLTYIKES